MKTKLLTGLCLVALGACSVNMCRADESAKAAVDVAVMRPACFAATIVGGALFLVSLPVAAMTKDGVHQSAHALVGIPAHAAFKRPMGDFRSLKY